MIKREDLVGKSQEEIQAVITEDAQLFAVQISELASEEEILNKERELMEVMAENEEYMKGIEYTLADSVTFDNTQYNKETVGKMIADFIATQEVEWSYTLGLFELVKLWKNSNLEKIQYHAYDSTLRILGTLKYKGVESWRKILTVNAYLGQCHNDYVRDTSYMLYLSQLHNTLIDALKKLHPEVNEETESVE